MKLLGFKYNVMLNSIYNDQIFNLFTFYNLIMGEDNLFHLSLKFRTYNFLKNEIKLEIILKY